MWISFFIFLTKTSFSANDEECLQWNTNCEQCLGLGKDSHCGWCKDTLSCYVANSEGTAPLNHTCIEWTFKFDMTCHLESQEPLPTGARIGLGVFAGFVAIATFSFWVCIFPHFCMKKKPEVMDQEQDEDDE